MEIIINMMANMAINIPMMILFVRASPKTNVPTRIAVIGSVHSLKKSCFCILAQVFDFVLIYFSAKVRRIYEKETKKGKIIQAVRGS